MIRETLEQHVLPGTIPLEEQVEPPFVAEAEVLVNAILVLAERQKGARIAGPRRPKEKA